MGGDGTVDDDDASPDADGDGEPAETDCDDQDPEVAPGLDEVCGDGKDNDCDPSTACYGIAHAATTVWVDPIEGQQDAVSFYGYSDDTYGGTHGFSLADTLALALYRDDEDLLSLLVSVDGEDDGSDGSLTMTVTDFGGASVLVADEADEAEEWDGVITLDFDWSSCCVDGALIGPLDADFCLEITLGGAQGLGGGVRAWESEEEATFLGEPEGSIDVCVGE